MHQVGYKPSSGLAPCGLIHDPLGPLGILSNYAITPFQVGEETWASVEHFYQAAKFPDLLDRQALRAVQRPHDAKELAWGVLHDRVRLDWDDMRVAVMDKALQAKFEQCGAARERLVATWPMPLAENSADDAFWGVGADGLGRDMLGRLLETRRARLTGLATPFRAMQLSGTMERGGPSRIELVPSNMAGWDAGPIREPPALVFGAFRHTAIDQMVWAKAPGFMQGSDSGDARKQDITSAHFRLVVDEMFDEKYANYTWFQDARCSVPNWVEQFRGILAARLDERFFSGQFLVLGAGSGNEAGQVWSEFGKRVLLSEIGTRLLQNCKSEAPQARVIRGRAESLGSIADKSQDLYCALRVYNSAYLDLPSSLAEAARVLKPGGIFIVSISNGYLTSSGSIVRGQIGPLGQLDPLAPWCMLMVIATLAQSLGFQSWQFHDLQSELVLSAVRSPCQ